MRRREPDPETVNVSELLANWLAPEVTCILFRVALFLHTNCTAKYQAGPLFLLFCYFVL